MSNGHSGVTRPREGFARPVGINPMAGTYDGKDLRPCATRPTRDIPTRVGARLMYRDGRVTDLQGTALPPAAPEPVAAMAAPVATPANAPATARKHMPAASPPAPLRTVSTRAAAPRTAYSGDYVPRAGSKPATLIAMLRAMGRADAHMGSAQVVQHFGVERRQWKNFFRAAIAHKHLLIVLHTNGEWALALPSYTPAA